MSLDALVSSFANSRIVDLAQPLRAGIPVSPNQPGFGMELLRMHGDRVREDGGSAANELISMGGHTGTHIDALCHVSHCGRLYGDVSASEVQSARGFECLGVETLPLTFARGVMLDIAALHGTDVLAPGHAIDSEELEGALERQGSELRPRDVLLLRTGWSKHWDDAETFLGRVAGAPGPNESAARWMVQRGVRMAVGETIAFEHIPPGRGHALLPVHRILLVEAGIPILEAANLSELARLGCHEFLFVLTPLRLVGATGVPVRPVAIVPDDGGDRPC